MKTDERGTTAIEFAMVAFPFFAMLFGIIAVGFYFFTTFTLENAVEDAARLVRTGQMQSVPAGATAGTKAYPASWQCPAGATDCSNYCAAADALDVCFKKRVCNSLPKYIDCYSAGSKLRINVASYADFTTAPTTKQACTDASNNLIATSSFAPGTASQVVLVSACYEWDLLKTIPFLTLGKLANGNGLIQASTVFMTEPY